MKDSAGTPSSAPTTPRAAIEQALRDLLTAATTTAATAAATTTDLAMLEGTGDGDGTIWLEPITDQQYAALEPDRAR